MTKKGSEIALFVTGYRKYQFKVTNFFLSLTNAVPFCFQGNFQKRSCLNWTINLSEFLFEWDRVEVGDRRTSAFHSGVTSHISTFYCNHTKCIFHFPHTAILCRNTGDTRRDPTGATCDVTDANSGSRRVSCYREFHVRHVIATVQMLQENEGWKMTDTDMMQGRACRGSSL